MLNWGLLLLRVGTAGMLLGLHGWGRLLKAAHLVVQGQQWTFVSVVQRLGFPVPPFFAVASAVAESIGSLLLIAGLFTRWAAAIVAFNMGVAVWLEVSKHSPEFEKPALYLIPVIVILAVGPGAYAVDAMRRGKAKGKRARAA